MWLCTRICSKFVLVCGRPIFVRSSVWKGVYCASNYENLRMEKGELKMDRWTKCGFQLTTPGTDKIIFSNCHITIYSFRRQIFQRPAKSITYFIIFLQKSRDLKKFGNLPRVIPHYFEPLARRLTRFFAQQTRARILTLKGKK